MRRVGMYLALLLVALLPFSSGLAAPAAQSGDVALNVQAGFDGYYQDDRWVPLRITVSNDGPDIDATLRAIDDNPFGGNRIIYSRPVELPSGSRKEVFLYFAPNGYVSQLNLELLDGNRRVLTREVSLAQVSASDVLYGIVSDNPSAFSELGLVMPVNGVAQVAVLQVADLPPVAEAWRALDVVVMSDVDTGGLTEQQRTAMHAWVTSGGRLILTGGPGWQRTAAGLGALPPVDVTGSARVDDVAALAQQTGLPLGQLRGETLVSEAQPHPGAQVAVSQDGLPLWVWNQVGMGRVDFLAVDPALEPLRSATQIDALWRTMLADGTAGPSWSNGFNTNWYLAREAVASIPGVSLPSALQLCGFLAIYAAIVGPLNYIVLRRIKRTELAWLTIPAIVLAFSGCAYVTGFQLRGSQAIVHRLALVQVWPSSEVARVDGVVGLWSPRRSAYDVFVGESYLAQPMPGDIGGVSVLSDSIVEEGQGSVIRDVRVDVGAVQSFLVQGYAPAPHVESDLVMSIDAAGGLRVDGEVHNTSSLDFEDAVILAAGASQHLGDLADGDSVSVGLSLLTGNALPAPVGGIQTGYSSGVPAYPGYAGYDTTVDDILGSSFCYGDVESQRRCNLLQAAIDPYGSSGGRGAGVYLVGWSDESLLEVGVVDGGSTFEDTAVYFLALPVVVEQSGQSVSLPPSLMTWSAVDDSLIYSGYTPYELYLSPTSEGPAAFRFKPQPIVAMDDYTGLTVHVYSTYTANEPPPNLDLWNWEEAEWQPVTIGWDDTRIQNPSRFVNPSGEVQLRVWIDANRGSLSLSRVDVTLEGESSG